MEEKKTEGIPTRLCNRISWRLLLMTAGITTGLIGFVSCASPGAHLSPSENQAGYPGHDSTLRTRMNTPASPSTNHEPITLHHQMLQQGNYSDAAILQSLQEFQPRATSMNSRVKDLTDQSPRMPFPNFSSSEEKTNTTLGAGWHTKVGWTLILDGNYPAAEAAYRQALRHETESAEAYLGLGMALMFQGKREQAIMAYEEALIIQPSYAAALVHLGYAYAGSSEDQENSRIKARSLFQQAYDLGDPFALLALMELEENKEGI